MKQNKEELKDKLNHYIRSTSEYGYMSLMLLAASQYTSVPLQFPQYYLNNYDSFFSPTTHRALLNLGSGLLSISVSYAAAFGLFKKCLSLLSQKKLISQKINQTEHISFSFCLLTAINGSLLSFMTYGVDLNTIKPNLFARDMSISLAITAFLNAFMYFTGSPVKQCLFNLFCSLPQEKEPKLDAASPLIASH